jgi:hypothetical protein
MQNGEARRLLEGHLDEVRNVKTASSNPAKPTSIKIENNNSIPQTVIPTGPATITLQSVLWGPHPIAIINGHSFFANDQAKIKLGTNSVTILCQQIRTNSASIVNLSSGEKLELSLRAK